MYKGIPVVIVAAMSRKRRAIGHGNGLLWHIPEDLKRFKELTRGHPLILGRKTFESILAITGGPLPKRQNIIVTRNPEYAYEGVEVVGSLDEAFEKAIAHEPAEIHIGGGSEMYAQALPYADRLHLTFVDDEPEADTFFPAFEEDFEVTRLEGPFDHNGIQYEWVDYVRREQT